MNQPPDHFDSIVDQFEAQWRTSDPPAVVEYLTRVAENEKQSLAKLLVPIDIEYRTKRGENVSATDYKHLGQDIQPIVQDAILSQIAQHTDDSDATKTHEPNNREQKSRVIGNYKLLQKLGEGGMGTVWMAEQERPVRRRVALKLIKAGHDSKEVVARFEAERQALAMMDHHNIAKVLDGGTTETGQPYFVMELVQGIPFNKYCDQHKLSINERLELFVPICNAVQHAHQKGIIHRDLKPSNILVSLYDGKPVPKVIDFGLAKALQHQSKLTDKTLFTEFGQVVGTLQYMSPEQAEMNQLDVDTRTDVYSLGVILYELLTGSTPIDADTLKNQAIFKVLESIRETEPPRPSVRLSSSTNEAVSGISLQRQIDPGKLKHILRGELDWIVMKALEKDRSRRYPAAIAMAQDIGRYLSGEAVEACPPSIGYRLRKSYRKNRLAFWSIGAIGFSLVAGICASSITLYYARRANDINTKLDADLRSSVRKFETRMTRDHWAKLDNETVGIVASLRDNVVSVLRDRATVSGTAEFRCEIFVPQSADEVVPNGQIGGDLLSVLLGQYVRIAVTFPQSRYFYLIALNPTDDSTSQVQLCYPDSPETKPELLNLISYPERKTAYFPFIDGVGQQVFLLLSSPDPLPSFGEFNRRWLNDLRWPPNRTQGTWIFAKGKVRPWGRLMLDDESQAEQFHRTMSSLESKLRPLMISVDAIAFPVTESR